MLLNMNTLGTMTKQSGFTLIELMITLAVVGILLALVVPNFNETLKNNRLTAYANEFVTNINYARTEAIKRGTTVTICSSNDDDTCSGSWQNGWLVFVDNNGNGIVDGGELIIRVFGGYEANDVTLDGDTATASFITFRNTGLTTLAGPSNLALCDNRGNTKGKAIEITAVGRISTAAGPASCTL